MQITVLSSTQPATLTKHISRGADGALTKTSSAHMTQGRATVCRIRSMKELDQLLDTLQPNQAVAYGVTASNDVAVVSEKYLASTKGAVTRSDKFFSWPTGAGVMYLDYDPADVVLGRDELLGALFNILPAAAASNWLWRPSASGNIYDAVTGEELVGLMGQHIYLAVLDASDIKRAGEVLFKRAWLKGYGRIVIAQNGAQLVRSVIDSAVWQPSRLDFAAGAVCGAGLERKPPIGQASEGGLLDTKIAIPDLTPDEERKYLEMVHEAKGRTLNASTKQRGDHIENVALAQGVSPDVIRARYDVAESKGILSNDFEIELAYDNGVVTVADILCNSAKYHNTLCLDPLEPDYNNRHPVGKIYNDSKGAYIDSKAHGGRIFSLGSITALVFQEQASEGATFKDLMAEIRAAACDLAETPALIERVNSGPFCEAEQVLLRAELEGGLKDAKRLTPELKGLIHGGKPEAPRARDVLPDVPTGDIVPQGMPLNPSKWAPFQTTGKDEKPKGTIDNFRIMASSYGVRITFNEISKDTVIDSPGHGKGGALRDEAALSRLISLANLNCYPKGDVPTMVPVLADENAFNPVKEWVFSRPWDTVDHIGLLFAEVTLHPDEDPNICEMLFRRWMRGAVAVGTGFSKGFENAIVWVDEMGGVGKTRFFRTLCDEDLRADGAMLDTKDKDSVKKVISNWLVELGELDGTFSKSDMADLKAFMSNEMDEIRTPYARASSKFRRTTAFMASVNQINFLVDDTGNRRFWPIRVTDTNHEHTVDIQQAWAQAYAEVMAGQTWYLSAEENRHCAIRNSEFKSASRIDDALSARIDTEGEPSIHLSCSELLTACGISNAHRGELNEAARWLRSHGVKEVKRQGKRGFMMAPLRGLAVVDSAFTPQ
jgi:predicted P-loop ATPase